MPSAADYTQTGFRIREDDGNETTATWKAVLNVNEAPALGVNFRLRFLVERAALGSNDSSSWQVYESYNGGTYTQIDDAGTTKAAPFVSANYTHEDESTQQIGSGTYNGSASNDAMCNRADFVVCGMTWSANGGSVTEIEIEMSVLIPPGVVSNGDTLEYRTRRSDDALNDYTKSPILTIVKGGIRINGGVLQVTGG